MADRQDRSLTARPFDDSLPPANNALWGAACFPFIVTNCRRREINENPLCTQKYPAPYKNRGLIIVRPHPVDDPPAQQSLIDEEARDTAGRLGRGAIGLAGSIVAVLIALLFI